MRFMMLYRPGVDQETAGPPDPEHMAKMGRLIAETTASGALLATDGLAPSSKGARLRRENGTTTVVDGPFAETKELIAGYAIMQAESREEAIGLARRFMEMMGEGETEVRQMQEMPAFPPDGGPPAPAAG